MVLNRDHLERAIVARLRECSLDELRVLERILDGIEQGRKAYGPLDVTRDVRLWKREAAMELRDWLFYTAAHEVAIDSHDRELRAEAFERSIVGGLEELRTARISESRAITVELQLCVCGHPQSVHSQELHECLVSCPCTKFEGV